MKNTANKLSPAARALIRALCCADRTNQEIRSELARHGYAPNVSKSLLSFYRRTRDRSAEEVGFQAHETIATRIVFVDASGQYQGTLLVENGELKLISTMVAAL